METLAKTRKLGGSLIVTIPKNVAQHENLYPGETVQINVKKVRKSYLGALKGIGRFTQEDKFDIE